MNKILVVAAHPDDELLGVGGTIARFTQMGAEVQIVIMCEGETVRYKENVGQKQAAANAAEMLGVSKLYQIGMSDQRLDTYTLTDIISPLEKISEEFNPNIVFCQYGGDINMDHQILFQAANVAFRPIVPWIEKVYAYYTVSSTEWGYPRTFVPDTWIDISSTLDKKINAFECYQSEVKDYPHPRSSAALRYEAHFWGNQCLMDAAEVFITIRSLKR